MKSSGEVFTFKTGEGETQRVYSYPLNEVNALAEQLGMDLDVDKEFLWFLKEALITILPMGWKKEENASGSTQYHNTMTGVTTETHPLLYIFRAAYSHLLEMSFRHLLELADPLDDSPQTTKQRRLEPADIVSLQNCEERQAFFAELMKKIEKKQEGMKDTAKFEQAMKDVDLFYSSLISRPTVPKTIGDTLEFQCLDPKKMMQYARVLGIHDDYRLLWVARVFAVLPLPPLWKRSFDAYRNEIFLNSQYNITLRYHPSKNYFYKFIQTLRFGDLGSSSLVMPFLDKKLRPYNVDLLRLMAGEEDFVVWVSDIPSLQFRRQSKIFKERSSVLETLDDVMALEIAESAGIELHSEMHLIGVVYQYFDLMKTKLRGWEFRFTLQGEKYWYHPVTQRATKSYPFKGKLRSVIEAARIGYFKQLNGVMKEKEEIHPGLKGARKDILSEIRAEASGLMRGFVANHIGAEKSEVQEWAGAGELLPFQVTTRKELDDVLYACPFRMSDSDCLLSSFSVLSFDIASGDEEVDAIEKEDVESILEELKRNDSRPVRPLNIKSKGLHALLARPRARLPTVPQEPNSPNADTPLSKESLSFRSKSQVGTVCKDIKDLVTEKALEAVKNLREAHNIKEVVSSGRDPRQSIGDFGDGLGSPKESVGGQLKFTGEGTKVLLNSLVKKITDKGGDSRSKIGVETGGIEVRISARQETHPSFRDSPVPPRDNPTPGRGSRLFTRSDSIRVDPSASPRTSVFSTKTTNFKSALARSMAFKSSLLLPSSGSVPMQLPKAEPEPVAAETSDEKLPFNPLSLAMAAISGKMLKLSKDVTDPMHVQQKLRTMLAQSIFQRHNEGVQDTIPEENAHQELIDDFQPHSVSPDPSVSKPFNMYKVLLGSLVRQKLPVLPISKDDPLPESLRDSQFSRQSNKSESSSSAGAGQILPSTLRKLSKRKLSSSDALGLAGNTTPTVGSPASSMAMATMVTVVGKEDASPTGVSKRSFSVQDSPRSSQSSKKPPPPLLPDLPPLSTHVFRAEGTPTDFSLLPRSLQASSHDIRKSFAAAFPQLAPRKRIHSGVSLSSPVTQMHSRSSSANPSEIRVAGDGEMANKDTDHLQYYVETFGSPFARFNIATIAAIPGVQPGDIVQMGLRLSMRVSNTAFESVESDMVWIPLFQLLAPLPPGYPGLSLAKALTMSFGDHPGDVYFQLMLDHNRHLRTKELKSMSRHEQVKSMVDRSWLELKNETGGAYRFNFLTGESGPVSAIEFIKFQKVFSLEEIPQAPGHRRTVSLQIGKPAAPKGPVSRVKMVRRPQKSLHASQK